MYFIHITIALISRTHLLHALPTLLTSLVHFFTGGLAVYVLIRVVTCLVFFKRFFSLALTSRTFAVLFAFG